MRKRDHGASLARFLAAAEELVSRHARLRGRSDEGADKVVVSVPSARPQRGRAEAPHAH